MPIPHFLGIIGYHSVRSDVPILFLSLGITLDNNKDTKTVPGIKKGARDPHDAYKITLQQEQARQMEMQLSLASWPLLLVLLLPLVCLLYLRQGHKRKQQQPRPHASDDDLKAYPILGRFPHLARNGHRLVEWSVEVAKQSPTTRTMAFKAPGLPGVVITANPDNLEHIAKTSFANYPKGDHLSSTLEDFLGHGIFNSDGEQWLRQRKAASFEFSKRSLRKFSRDRKSVV